jgi:hypothetical protein
MAKNAYEYDVALSFAGKDREYVEQVAQLLRQAKIRVFYDGFETPNLLGKNLHDYFATLFGERARYCVIFISQAYATSMWTIHERRSAQERALQEKEEYILPARFDDTALPGLGKAVGYVDLRRTTPSQLADLVIAKLNYPSRALQEASALWESHGWTTEWLLTEADLVSVLAISPEYSPSDQFAAFAIASLIYYGRIVDAGEWTEAKRESAVIAELLAKYAQLKERRVRYRAAAFLHRLSDEARSLGVERIRNLGDSLGFADAIETGDFSLSVAADTSLSPRIRGEIERELETILGKTKS